MKAAQSTRSIVAPKRTLTLEQLEDRTVPSTIFGNPWPNPQAMTLSFVPDGTPVSAGALSNLFGTLNQVAPTHDWEMAILQAFQTWAVNANINVGIVSDSGAALGASGAVQGDPRFGDIRISGRNLPLTSMATSSPYLLGGSTWSGDVMFNTAQSLGINGQGKYDLFTCALQEAGHVFGLDNSSDTASPMYEYYEGIRTALTATDISNLQALYGAPQADQYQAGQGNGTFQTAALLNPVVNGMSYQPLQVKGDITTTGQTEYFQLGLDPSSCPGGITLQLHTNGLSLFSGQLTVLDANQTVLAAASEVDPLSGDVCLQLSQAQLQNGVYLQVQGSRSDVFGQGAYQLNVNFNPGATPTLTAAQTSGATAIGVPSLYNGIAPLTISGTYTQANQTDVYSLNTAGINTAAGMTVAVQTWGIGTAQPRLSIYDTNGNLLASTNTANPTTGLLTLQFAQTVPSSTYYLAVQGGLLSPDGAGRYFLGVSFQPPGNAIPALQAGLSALDAAPTANTSLASAQAMAGSTSHYQTVANLSTPGTTNYFKFQTPSSSQNNVMIVTLTAAQTGGARPDVIVYDANGNRVTATILTSAAGQFVVSVKNINLSATYYLGVSAIPQGGNGILGDYFLGVTFATQPPPAWQAVAWGTLTTQQPQQTWSLNLDQNQLFDLGLACSTSMQWQQGTMTATIYDSNNNAVFSLVATSGQPPVTGTVYLGTGSYTIRFTSSVPNMSYCLNSMLLSDPIGPQLVPPLNNPAPPPGSIQVFTQTASAVFNALVGVWTSPPNTPTPVTPPVNLSMSN
jgi:hypothetical protein